MYRFWRSLAMMTALVLALSGCTGSADLIVPGDGQPDLPTVTTVHVASMRARGSDGEPGDQRADALNFFDADVYVPPQRVRGSIYRRGPSTALGRNYVSGAERGFDDATAFAQAVAADAAARGTPREALIFVHGFNVAFETTLHRTAQIDADLGMKRPKILFAWPSGTVLQEYLRDLDSAYYSRNALERLIKALGSQGITRIELVGHSMGAPLIMETLRQMRLKGEDRALSFVESVIFLSPDMDVDRFVADAHDLAPLPEPFVIYTSRNDWVLHGFDDFFLGGQDRLGIPKDMSVYADLKLIFVDSAGGGGAGEDVHFTVMAQPGIIRALHEMDRPDIAGFAEMAASGGIPGSRITRYGKTISVVLPDLE